MPRGKNAVRMAELRELLSANGFTEVRTWIQSGNVALNSPFEAEATATCIQQLLATHLHAELAVIVKTRAQLQTVLDNNPFSAENYTPARVFYTLCNQPLQNPSPLNAQDFGEEKLHITPQHPNPASPPGF